MATINITGGGVDTRQASRATDATTKPASGAQAAETSSQRRILGEPKTTPDAPTPRKPVAEEQQQLTADDMRTAVADIQQAIDKSASAPLTVAFRPDDTSLSFVIEIRDDNDELVWQFPSEKVLNLRSKLDELSGMVIDQVT